MMTSTSTKSSPSPTTLLTVKSISSSRTADSKGYVHTHIVLPSMVYGIADHALVDAGVSNAISQTIPALAWAALDRKRAGVVGKGRAKCAD